MNHESPHRKEDLIVEATALVTRVEIKLPDSEIPVVVGFRREGEASFFFGEEPVYQFNALGELRRCYLNGIIKVDRRRLVTVRKSRSEAGVQLISHEMSTEEQSRFISDAEKQLGHLLDVIRDDSAQVIRQVSDGEPVLEQVATWLEKLFAGGGMIVAEKSHLRI